MPHTHCAVQGCKISIFNKPVGVNFHSCPSSIEIRSKWLYALRNKCPMLDWTKSRICSKHFENKYFDSQRKLKDNAIPTLFPLSSKFQKNNDYTSKDKIDKLLNKLTQTELLNDIRNSMSKFKEPINFDRAITDDLQCKADATIETQLLLLVKKQNHLNIRLLELLAQKNIEARKQKGTEETKPTQKDVDHNIETYKYIVKCLQEKLVNYEEQIEILTTVEAR